MNDLALPVTSHVGWKWKIVWLAVGVRVGVEAAERDVDVRIAYDRMKLTL